MSYFYIQQYSISYKICIKLLYWYSITIFRKILNSTFIFKINLLSITNHSLTKQAKLPVMAISVVALLLVSISSSLDFNAYAKGGSSTGGDATGQGAIGGAAIGGNANGPGSTGGAATGGTATGNNAAGGDATGGSAGSGATGGLAKGGNETIPQGANSTLGNSSSSMDKTPL
jgi:hypothetical protein